MYFIDINTHSISKIYEINKNEWIQSLYLLKDGNIIAGVGDNLMIFKKIDDNDLELIFDIKNIHLDDDDYHVISSIKEDINKNIIISLYNGKIKIFKRS